MSIWCPRRSWNAGWPATSPCILACVHHVLSNQPITLQDPHRKGRGGVNGSSQWAPALDWSRHNYHVNILLRIRWYNTHTLSGCMFSHRSRWTNILWWVSYGTIKELKRVWRRNERHWYRGTLCMLLHCVLPLLRVYLQPTDLEKYLICTHDSEHIILRYLQMKKLQLKYWLQLYVYFSGSWKSILNYTDTSIKDILKSLLFPNQGGIYLIYPTVKRPEPLFVSGSSHATVFGAA